MERVTHLVEDDGTGISTIISFDANGNINSIYQQNGLTGEIINQIYITHINGITYLGDELETFSVTESIEIEDFGTFLNSSDDILLSQTLNQNKTTLEQLSFLISSENSNRSIASFSPWLIVIGTAVAVALAFSSVLIDSLVGDVVCQYDNTCGQQRLTNNSNNLCSILSNDYVCSSIENVIGEREDTSNIFITLCGDSICILDNAIIDPRDGQIYQIIEINNRTWFAQNLNFNISGSIGNGNYGRLYTWNSAIFACPPGWYLPSDLDWSSLEVSLGLNANLANSFSFRGAHATSMKSSTFWNGTNTSGFNVLPAGYFEIGFGINGTGNRARFWTSTDVSGSQAIRRQFENDEIGVGRTTFDKDFGYSCRCIKF
ncbi:MAG: hypothetical protein GYB32_10730 [Algicola sp.]|nr:hypothetical protein [Algicola sp.]